jgi:ribosome-associated protein
VTKAAWKAAAGVKAGAKASKKVARKKVPVPAKKKVAAARGKGPKTANAARRRLGTKALANAGAVMSTAGAGGAAGAGAERVGEALTAQQRAARTFAIEAAQMLADDKCTDVVVLDVRGMNSLADYIVVATGTSDRQMRFCALNLKDKAEAMGHGVARKNEDERTTWVVLDCMDVVVHIFEPNTRAHYDIENMWADALKVEWARAAGTRPPGLARRG